MVSVKSVFNEILLESYKISIKTWIGKKHKVSINKTLPEKFISSTQEANKKSGKLAHYWTSGRILEFSSLSFHPNSIRKGNSASSSVSLTAIDPGEVDSLPCCLSNNRKAPKAPDLGGWPGRILCEKDQSRPESLTNISKGLPTSLGPKKGKQVIQFNQLEAIWLYSVKFKRQWIDYPSFGSSWTRPDSPAKGR